MCKPHRLFYTRKAGQTANPDINQWSKLLSFRSTLRHGNLWLSSPGEENFERNLFNIFFRWSFWFLIRLKFQPQLTARVILSFLPFVYVRIPFFLCGVSVSINESIFAHSQLVIHDKSFPEEVLIAARSFAWQASKTKEEEIKVKKILLYLLFLSSVRWYNQITSVRFAFRNGKLSNAACVPFVTNRGNSKVEKDGNCWQKKNKKNCLKNHVLFPSRVKSSLVHLSAMEFNIFFFNLSPFISLFLPLAVRPLISWRFGMCLLNEL